MPLEGYGVCVAALPAATQAKRPIHQGNLRRIAAVRMRNMVTRGNRPVRARRW